MGGSSAGRLMKISVCGSSATTASAFPIAQRTAIEDCIARCVCISVITREQKFGCAGNRHRLVKGRGCSAETETGDRNWGVVAQSRF